MITVGELMNRELVTVSGKMSADYAAKLMSNCKIGSVLVEQNHHIIGIVTESDIVRKVVGADQTASLLPMDSIMSAPVIGIDERRPITEAADLMHRNGIRHLLVRSATTVVGVLSVRDLLRPVSIDDF